MLISSSIIAVVEVNAIFAVTEWCSYKMHSFAAAEIQTLLPFPASPCTDFSSHSILYD